jgi:outer membrane protein assembly factor BamB
MSESPFSPPESSGKSAAPVMAAKNSLLSIFVPCFVLIALWGAPAVVQKLAPDSIGGFFFSAIILPTICLLIMIGYWLLLKSVRGQQRFTVLGVLIVLLAIVFFASHKSLGGMAMVMYGTPAVVTAMALWLLVSRGLKPTLQSAGMMGLSGLVGLAFCMLRVHGVTGSFAAEFDWRWNPSSEERLIASKGTQPDATGASADTSATDSAKTLTLQPTDWPEFRGPQRDSIVRGSKLSTDWSANPPKDIWRKPIGPAWSSFSIVDGHVFTQ